jgi:hypothetical protein
MKEHMMSKLTAIVGYTLAVLMIPLTLVTFIGMPALGEWLVSTTGVTVSPWFTGGEVVQTVDHGEYRTLIRRPVFDWLIGKRPDGFVQIDWAPLDALPARIDEDIDFDDDGQKDFRIELDTRFTSATLTPHNLRVKHLEGVYRLEDALAIRVALQNTP